MVPNEALRQIIDENMHQSYNFKAVSLMKKGLLSSRSQMISIHKIIGFDTKNRSPASSKVEYLLLEVVLDLLHPILDLQINLMPLKMVPNDSPYPKTEPEPCLYHAQKLS